MRGALTLSALLLLAGCASAPPPPPHGPPGRAGGSPPCATLFVSPAGEPFRSRGGACPLQRWFAQADADHDGALTREEMRGDALAFFTQLDLNGDGVLDGSEVARYEREVLPEMMGGFGPGGEDGGGRRGRPPMLHVQGPGGMGGGGMGGGGRGGGRRGGQGGGPPRSAPGGAGPQEGAARFSLFDEPEPITSADANLDGKVTRAEFAKASDAHFRELDTAGAGGLLLPDLEAKLAARHGGGRGRGRPRG